MATYRTLEEALTRGRGRERAFRCPVHGDSHASASVNVVKGWWTCYVCGAKGTTTDIIEGEDFEFGQGLVELLDEGEDAREYPEAWLDLVHRPGLHHPYWLSRFWGSTIDHFRLGYDHVKGQPCYPMRAPDGTVLGLVYRQLDREPKYLYPRGVTKSELLFGYTSEHRESVLLVEGALDAVACWESGSEAFALYGAQISAAQLALLQRTGVTKVGLVLDNDAAGVRAVKGWFTDEGRYVPGIEWWLGQAGIDSVSMDWTGQPFKDIAEAPAEVRTTLLRALAP